MTTPVQTPAIAAGSGSATAKLAAATTAGNSVWAFIADYSNNNAISAPTGWTLITASICNYSGYGVWCAWMQYTASGTPSIPAATGVTITGSGSDEVSISLYELPAGGTIDTGATNQKQGTSATSPQTNTIATAAALANANEFVMAGMVQDDGGTVTWTPSSGWTVPAHTAGNGGGFVTAYQSVNTQAIQTCSLLTNGSSDYGASIIAVNFPSGGVTGTGAVTAPPVHLSASGAESISGSGGVAVGRPALAASGTVADPVTGSGAVSAPPIGLAAAAAETIAGSGGVQAPAVELAGSATEVISGSGAIDAPSIEVAASGAEVVSGAAAVVAPAVELAGSGAETVSGSAAVDAPPIQLAAAASEVVSGGAAVAAPPVEIAGTGSEEFAGSGAVAFGPPELAGTGTVTTPDVAGSGAIVAPPIQVAGSGAEAIDGTGAIQIGLPELVASGTSGAEAITGTGAIVAPPFALAARGGVGAVAPQGTPDVTMAAAVANTTLGQVVAAGALGTGWTADTTLAAASTGASLG